MCPQSFQPSVLDANIGLNASGHGSSSWCQSSPALPAASPDPLCVHLQLRWELEPKCGACVIFEKSELFVDVDNFNAELLQRCFRWSLHVVLFHRWKRDRQAPCVGVNSAVRSSDQRPGPDCGLVNSPPLPSFTSTLTPSELKWTWVNTCTNYYLLYSLNMKKGMWRGGAHCWVLLLLFLLQFAAGRVSMSDWALCWKHLCSRPAPAASSPTVRVQVSLSAALWLVTKSKFIVLGWCYIIYTLFKSFLFLRWQQSWLMVPHCICGNLETLPHVRVQAPINQHYQEDIKHSTVKLDHHLVSHTVSLPLGTVELWTTSSQVMWLTSAAPSRSSFSTSFSLCPWAAGNTRYPKLHCAVLHVSSVTTN